MLDMTPSSSEIEVVLSLLAETPVRIQAAVHGIDPVKLHARSKIEDWSVNDILAHLRACAEVWGKSIHAMLVQDQPTLRYVSPRTWIKKTHDLDQEFHISLNVFIQQRGELLDTLHALETPAWSRGAHFTGNTQGKHHTVFTYARRMAYHETEHCQQIESIVKVS
jgi:hypothetical protein